MRRGRKVDIQDTCNSAAVDIVVVVASDHPNNDKYTKKETTSKLAEVNKQACCFFSSLS